MPTPIMVPTQVFLARTISQHERGHITVVARAVTGDALAIAFALVAGRREAGADAHAVAFDAHTISLADPANHRLSLILE
jgi:hypothetical protein